MPARCYALHVRQSRTCLPSLSAACPIRAETFAAQVTDSAAVIGKGEQKAKARRIRWRVPGLRGRSRALWAHRGRTQ